MTPELDSAQLAAGWTSLAEAASYTHYRPLSDAAYRFITDTQTAKRVFTGIGPLDYEMRGISAGHLAMIVGYSHSGKTLVALHILANNRDKRIAYFVPDEPAPLVLTKLACMDWKVSGAELEARVRDGDPWGTQALATTIERFPNLAVFDRPLSPRAMTQGYEEACDHWGAEPDLVIVDYMDLLQIGDSVIAKADYLKAFGTAHDVPMIVLHQTSRSAGARGQAMRIDSGSYGGETHATFQIGVWRKLASIHAELDDLEAKSYRPETWFERVAQLQRDLQIHQYTLSINLNKNKRPSGRLIDEITFEMDTETGTLQLLQPGDLPIQFRHPHLRAVT